MMPRLTPPPAEAKLVARRREKLQTLLNRVTFGRLQNVHDGLSRIHSIEPGQGSTEFGFRLFDGGRFLYIAERHIFQGGRLVLVAYKYQLSWPDDGVYQVPNEWIFRFDYDAYWGARPGFAGEPHLMFTTRLQLART